MTAFIALLEFWNSCHALWRIFVFHTDLHSPGASCRVGAHLEQAGLGRFGLTSLPGCASLMHHYGLSTKQTHKVCRLLTLNHTHLRNTNTVKSCSDVLELILHLFETFKNNIV